MTTRIEHRTRELMLDGMATVELLEEIQQENGPAQQAMTRALHHVLEHPPRSPMHEFGLNFATFILTDRARLRAAREYSQGALT
jgi:hypothetical protein